MLEFGLQLPPVGVFTGPQHIPEFMLHSPQFFPVSRPERPLLLVKKSFQVIGDPSLIVRESAYRGCGTVCILSIYTQKIQCVIISGGAVNILVK